MLIAVESSHTLTPAGTISNTSVTPAGTVNNTSVTPAGTVNNTSVTPAGTIGNKDITPAGTIGTHSLTVAEMPAHTHGRGTIDITGYIGDILTNNVNSASGAIYTADYVTGAQHFSAGNYDRARIDIHFQASKNWSGASESKGSGKAHGHSWTGTKNTHNHTFTGTAANHNHTFTGTAANHNHTFTGTQATINHMNPYIVVYCFKRIS